MSSELDGRQRLDVPKPAIRPKRGLPRAADMAIAVIGLVLASPLLLLAAIAIKLETRGPVLYRQGRVGRDGVRVVHVHAVGEHPPGHRAEHRAGVEVAQTELGGDAARGAGLAGAGGSIHGNDEGAHGSAAYR